MALSASNVFEINSAATASNVNGGGFNPSNANMLADLTTNSNTANTSAPIVSSASYNFVAGDVNHWLYIKSGTNWTPGWYKIDSVASNKATLSAAIGSASVVQVVNNFYGTNTVVGCATVGTPTSGTFTIDYSQSTASPFPSTDIAVVTTTTLTSATNPFGKNMVGNLIHITAGTATAGWYEIVSVSGTTATIDRSAVTTGTGNTGAVGGALSLGSSDDAVFELGVSSATASTRYFFKGGSSITYTLGGFVVVNTPGNVAWPFIYESYVTIRGDRPTGVTRPTIDAGTSGFTPGTQSRWYSLIFKSTATAGVTCQAGVYFECCKFINPSASVGSTALDIESINCTAYKCEAWCIRGRAIKIGNTAISCKVIGCYFHDSDTGLLITTSAADATVVNNIFACNVTAGINNVTNPITGNALITGNTFYGAENKLGKGINLMTGSTLLNVFNNIFYGFVTGVAHADTQARGIDDYNAYNNNTNDVSAAGQWQKGLHDITASPSFTSVTQRTGSTATTTSGNHLVQSGATFVTWGVAVGDFVQIVSGTGPTAGQYTILTVDSETQITTNETLTADATANKVWQITQGRNFGVGTNMKALAYPGEFPGALTTGYLDIGAAQRQEPVVSFTFAG